MKVNNNIQTDIETVHFRLLDKRNATAEKKQRNKTSLLQSCLSFSFPYISLFCLFSYCSFLSICFVLAKTAALRRTYVGTSIAFFIPGASRFAVVFSGVSKAWHYHTTNIFCQTTEKNFSSSTLSSPLYCCDCESDQRIDL